MLRRRPPGAVKESCRAGETACANITSHLLAYWWGMLQLATPACGRISSQLLTVAAGLTHRNCNRSRDCEYLPSRILAGIGRIFPPRSLLPRSEDRRAGKE